MSANPPFRPNARQAGWLVAVAILSLGYALYLRYRVVENVPIGLACDAGQESLACLSRRIALTLDTNGSLGWISLGSAIVAFIRPGVVLLSLALVACALGLVMHNAALAGIAGGLIVFSLARPAVAPD